MNVAEAYFRVHGSTEFVTDLERFIASATPPASFEQRPPQAHRGRAVANRNAASVAALRGAVPRG